MDFINKTILKGLKEINYKFHGLTEKICKTQKTVLEKKVKVKVRSIKDLGWIWMQASKGSKGLWAKVHKT
jgi:hypothetical protein